MKHPGDGVLRRLLDEPVAVGDADRSHVATCARCSAGLAAAERDRHLVTAALAVPGPRFAGERADGQADDEHSHLDQAWERLQARLGQPEGARRPRAVRVLRGTRPAGGAVALRPRPLSERFARRPVAIAVAAGLAALGGTAAAAAADWLPIFRTERVAPVEVSPQEIAAIGQLGGLADLSRYGEVRLPASTRPVTVPDAATAAARTGLQVPRIAHRPAGVTGAPTYQVVTQQSLEFTFSAAKAARAARDAGAALPPMPAGLDGTRLLVKAGPGVLLTWGHSAGIPSLVIGRTVAPSAMTQGASLPVVRDYLLALPGIPSALAAQLKAVTGDGTTLPLPVPSQLATSSSATVDGVAATVVQLRDGAAAGVVWVRDGVLTGVAGPLTRDEVLEVARDLRPA